MGVTSSQLIALRRFTAWFFLWLLSSTCYSRIQSRSRGGEESPGATPDRPRTRNRSRGGVRLRNGSETLYLGTRPLSLVA